MARSVLAAAAIVCLTALSAAAQITNNYWLSIPPATGQTPPKPPPAPEIPDVPFAPARNVRLAASIGIDKGFRPAGLWAPLWLGPQMVALPGTLHGGIALMAWYADRFNRSRVIADTSTVRGAAILDMALSRDGKRLAIAAAAGDKLQIWTRDTQRDTPASLIAAIDGACDKAGVAWLGGDTLAVGARVIPAAPAPAQLPIVIQTQHTPAAAPQPKHIVDIVQSAREQQPQ